jgi:hypothetical protein
VAGARRASHDRQERPDTLNRQPFRERGRHVPALDVHTPTPELMSNTLRRVVVASWKVLHDFWLIVGISLLLLLLMEACFRVKDAVGGKPGGPLASRPIVRGDPRAEPWYQAFDAEYDAARLQRWRPFLYWGRLPSFRGRYINIDSLGRRTIPQPAQPAEPVARVFFFGGSTMWGDSQREDHTIAAVASQRMQALAGPGARVEVTNFGESGYVSMQEIVQLELALRDGARPDVVVFYDGLNDVSSTVQEGEPGLPQNEAKRVSEFEMGRALDRTGLDHGLGRDLHALGLLGGQAVRQLSLSDWVLSLKRTRPETNYPPADSAAHATARAYAANARLVEALGAQYGFTPIYVWQTSVHATEKEPTPYERWLLGRIARNSFHSRIQQVHRLMPPLIDSAMTAVAPGRFVDEAHLFRGDTMAVFTDWLGHNTEQAVPRIVDGFWPPLERAVRAAIARPHPAEKRPGTLALVPSGRP